MTLEATNFTQVYKTVTFVKSMLTASTHHLDTSNITPSADSNVLCFFASTVEESAEKAICFRSSVFPTVRVSFVNIYSA